MIGPVLLLLTLAAGRDTADAPRARHVVTLPTERVEGTRVSEARRRLPTAFATEVRLADHPRAELSLAEALATVAGAHVTRLGGLGAFATVSLRDAAPGQVTVMLDGVPLSSAAHAVVDLAGLPATAADHVEVYRGLAPLALGGGAGGAVNVVTTTRAQPRATLARGSFGTWDAHGTAGATRGAWSAMAHGGWQHSRGDFRYLDDYGTPLEPADDAWRPRQNDRVDLGTALGSVQWARGGTRLRLRGNVVRKDQGLPGAGNIPAQDAHLSSMRALGALALTTTPAPGGPAFELEAQHTAERTRFRDLRLPWGGELGGTRHDADTHARVDRLRGAVSLARGPLSLEGAGDLRHERETLADPADGRADPPPAERTAGALSATARLTLRPLTLHVARRWERMVDALALPAAGGARLTRVARELGTPQAGAAVALPLGFEARANWTDAARAPEFLELFGDQATVAANPGLKPERVRARDAGLAWHGARGPWRGRMEAARFAADGRDLVVWWRNAPNTVRADNLLTARTRGTELSLGLDAPGGLSLAGAATWSEARNTSPRPPAWAGRRLPLRPARTAWLGAGWRQGAWQCAVDLDHAGETWLDMANRQRVPPRTLLGTTLARTLARGAFRVVAEGRNLGDVRAYDTGGFPLPGRSVSLACEARLGAPEP